MDTMTGNLFFENLQAAASAASSAATNPSSSPDVDRSRQAMTDTDAGPSNAGPSNAGPSNAGKSRSPILSFILDAAETAPNKRPSTIADVRIAKRICTPAARVIVPSREKYGLWRQSVVFKRFDGAWHRVRPLSVDQFITELPAMCAKYGQSQSDHLIEAYNMGLYLKYGRDLVNTGKMSWDDFLDKMINRNVLDVKLVPSFIRWYEFADTFTTLLFVRYPITWMGLLRVQTAFTEFAGSTPDNDSFWKGTGNPDIASFKGLYA